MRQRRKWIFKQQWYSICSAHYRYDENCPRCRVGQWHNVYIVKIDHWFYANVYWLWHWCHNRDRSRVNRFLRQHFPRWE